MTVASSPCYEGVLATGGGTVKVLVLVIFLLRKIIKGRGAAGKNNVKRKIEVGKEKPGDRGDVLLNNIKSIEG